VLVLILGAAGLLVLVLFSSWDTRGYHLEQRETFSMHDIKVKFDRPSLSSLIRRDNKANTFDLTGEPVDWLLDFVLAGHAKCATTSIMQSLHAHPEIQMYNQELYSLHQGDPASLVRLLYQLPKGDHFQRGYKAPTEIERLYSILLLQKYFSKTKIIVGLRHPVWWFQSWYNFKKAQGFLKQQSMTNYVDRPDLWPPSIEFHKNLAQLGKTDPLRPDELALLGNYPRPIKPAHRLIFDKLGFDDNKNLNATQHPRLPNKVFLYMAEQVDDPATSSDFRADLQKFLGLSHALRPIPHNNTAEMHVNPHHQDICDAPYDGLRSQLVALGQTMADWILKYFMDNVDVTVAPPETFVRLLQAWSKDPCQLRYRNVTTPN
jgi:hypothetical protein